MICTMYKKSQNQRNVHPQQQLSLLCDLLYTIYFILLSSHTQTIFSLTTLQAAAYLSHERKWS